MARKNSRARHNMAVRVPFQGQMIEFDTPQEAAAFVREMGTGGAPPQAAPSGAAFAPPGHAAPAAVAWAKPPPPTARRRSLLDDVPEDYKYKGAYATAGMLLGGQGSFCPSLRADAKRKRVTLSNQKALRSMGLEPDTLFQFLTAVSQAHPEAFVPAQKKDGTPYNKVVRDNITPAIIATAHQILSQTFGISCPTGQANNNPWYGRF